MAKLHSSKKKIKISFHSLVILLILFDSKNNRKHDGDKGGEKVGSARSVASVKGDTQLKSQ